MQEHWGEKLKGLLIHSCKSVNVTLDGEIQLSFWNSHGNGGMSVFKGFHSLQLKWQEILLKVSKVAGLHANSILNTFLNSSHILYNIV